MKTDRHERVGTGLATLLIAFGVLIGTAWEVGSAQTATSTPDERAASEEVLEEIVVSARRRPESVMTVPAAVSAFDREDISRYMATDFKKIGELSPQVYLAEATAGSGASFTIRGVGSAAANLAIEQAVSLNIDGVQVGRGRFIKLGLLDLEQVEVLKGPQALFFGKNSPAGVISITSVSPGTEMEGYVRGGYEFEADERYVEGALTYPFSNEFRVRVAIRDAEMDGWVENLAEPIASPFDPSVIMPPADRGPSLDETIARLTAVYEPTQNLDATLKVTVNKTEKNTSTNAAQPVCADESGTPLSFGIPDPFGECRLDQNRSAADLPSEWAVDWPAARGGPSFMDQDALMSSLEINYRLDTGTITSLSGWASYDFDSNDDFAYASISSVFGTNVNSFEQLSQEFRFSSDLDSPFNFTAGAFFEDANFASVTAAMLGYAGPDPDTGRFYAYERFGEIDSRSYSLFGQLRWRTTDALELSVGARWTRDEKELVSLGHSFNHAVFAPAFAPVGLSFNGEFEDTDVSPEATISYFLSDTSMLYGAYKTGYKSGGFSLPGNVAIVETLDSLEFSSETADGFEVGYKSELLGRSLRLEVVAFLYEFDDLQVSSFDADTTRFIVRNAAKLESRGIEVSTLWQATNELTVRAAVGFSQAEYDQFDTSSCYLGQTEAEGCIGGVQDLSGEAPPRAPDWAVNLGATYTTSIGDFDLTASGDAIFVEGHNVQENNNPVAFQDSFWRLNAAVRLIHRSSGLEFALIGRNLTDEYYLESSTDKPVGAPGEIGPGLPRPREVALQATWRY